MQPGVDNIYCVDTPCFCVFEGAFNYILLSKFKWMKELRLKLNLNFRNFVKFLLIYFLQDYPLPPALF